MENLTDEYMTTRMVQLGQEYPPIEDFVADFPVASDQYMHQAGDPHIETRLLGLLETKRLSRSKRQNSNKEVLFKDLASEMVFEKPPLVSNDPSQKIDAVEAIQCLLKLASEGRLTLAQTDPLSVSSVGIYLIDSN